MSLKVMAFIFKSQALEKKKKKFLFLFSSFKHSVLYIKKQLKIQSMSL